MRPLWRIEGRWPAVVLFLIWLLAVWAITFETWLFDAGSGAGGINPMALFLNSTVPFMAGALAGWPLSPPATRFRGLLRSALAGLLVMEFNLAGELLLWTFPFHWIVGGPLVEPAGLADGLRDLLDLALTAGVVGLLLGVLGGFVTGLLPQAACRAHED